MENILIMKNMSIDKFFSVTLVTRREIKGNVKSFMKKRRRHETRHGER